MMAYTAQYLPIHRTVTYDHNSLDRNGHLSVSNNNIVYTKETDVNTYQKQVNGDIYLKYPKETSSAYNKGSYNDNNNNTLSVNMDDSASTIMSPSSPTSPPPNTFHLVRRSSFHASRVEAPPIEQMKVDTYNVGVIMESKMTGRVFDPEKLKVEAVAPTGRVIKISGDGHYAAPFNKDEIGKWKVSMFYDGKYMDGCPLDVCDPSQVRVRELQGGHVGKHNTFFVDCTKAGKGDIGVDVTQHGRPVVTHVLETSTPRYYKASFMPYTAGPYDINVHFNRAEIRESDFHTFDTDDRQRKVVFDTKVVPYEDYIEIKASCDWEVDYITGGPFVCHVTDVTDIAVYGMQDGTVCAHPSLIADCTHVGDGRIDADYMYNSVRHPCKIRREKPAVYRVSFKPRGPGTYKIWIYYNGQPVKGSPFVQEIEELQKPKAYGDGLYRGVPGKPTVFTIDPRGSPGQVSVGINGPTKAVDGTLDTQPDNTIKCTYYPTERGPHTVAVKLDGEDIEGSPFRPLVVDPVNVRVSGGWRPYLDDKGVIPLRVGKEKHLPFDVSEAGPGELTSEVQGPNGKIPVAIDARNDGKHSVVFTPREEGKHNIHVNWGGYPLTNSPYLGYATHEPELAPNEANCRLIPIQYSDRVPSIIGSAPGSAFEPPQTYAVNGYPDTEAAPPRVIYYKPEANPAPVFLNSPPPPVQPTVSIIKKEPTIIRRDDMYRPGGFIYYSPQYEIPKTDNAMYVPQPIYIAAPPPQPQLVQTLPMAMTMQAEPVVNGGAVSVSNEETKAVPKPDEDEEEVFVRKKTKVKVEQKSFDYSSDYSNSKVKVLPMGIPEEIIEDRSRASSVHSSVRADDVDTEAANPRIITAESPGVPQKLILSGKGLKEADENVMAEFYVDGTNANVGSVSAHLEDIHSSRVPVTVQETRPQVYRCTYLAKKKGAYLLYVFWNSKAIKGSPFKVDVHGAGCSHAHGAAAATTAVVAAGAANASSSRYVKSGQTSTKNSKMTSASSSTKTKTTTVGTINQQTIGTGSLYVKCTDPWGREIPVRLVDLDEGNRSLKVTPHMTGRHMVEIRRNGELIMGSPYAIDIKDLGLKPLRVWGPGVENGILGQYQSTFWIDTAGAGGGDLKVQVMGPKGAFNVRMRKVNEDEHVFQIYYDPVEPGIYSVDVRWSGKHTEGSPYTVLLGSTEEELRQLIEDMDDSQMGTIGGSVRPLDTGSVISRNRGKTWKGGSVFVGRNLRDADEWNGYAGSLNGDAGDLKYRKSRYTSLKPVPMYVGHNKREGSYYGGSHYAGSISGDSDYKISKKRGKSRKGGSVYVGDNTKDVLY